MFPFKNMTCMGKCCTMLQTFFCTCSVPDSTPHYKAGRCCCKLARDRCFNTGYRHKQGPTLFQSLVGAATRSRCRRRYKRGPEPLQRLGGFVASQVICCNVGWLHHKLGQDTARLDAIDANSSSYVSKPNHTLMQSRSSSPAVDDRNLKIYLLMCKFKACCKCCNGFLDNYL